MMQDRSYFRPPAGELEQVLGQLQPGQTARLAALVPLIHKLPPHSEAPLGATPQDLLAFVRANPAPYLIPEEPGAWDLTPTAIRGLLLLAALDEPGWAARERRDLLAAIYEHAEYLYCFNVHREPLVKALGAAFLTLAGFCLPAFAAAEPWRLAGMCRLLSYIEPTPSRLQEPGVQAVASLRRGAAAEVRALRDEQRGPLLREAIAFATELALEKNLPVLPEWAEYYTLEWGTNLRNRSLAGLPTTGLRADDEGFWRALNLDHPGLEAVKAAAERGDWVAAKAAYLDHVGRLTAFAEPFLTGRDTAADLGEADDICRNVLILRAHMYVRHDYGPQVDWTTILFDDLESNVSINGHLHSKALALAYRRTGDEKYMRHLVRLWRSWYDTSPVLNRWQPLTQWRTLEVGARSGQQWPYVLLTSAQHPIFREGMLWEMAKSYLEHGRYLQVHQASGANNWFQVETGGLAATALLFPEFRESARFMQCALRRMEWINRECFLPDGFQSECSTAYHGFPVNGIGVVYHLARLLGVTLTPTFERDYQRMLDMYVYMAKPDLTLPTVNDCGPSILSAAQNSRLSAALFPEREDFRYISTARAEGRPPAETSFAFPYAGYYVMRESWDPQAMYLLFDAGYYGSNHQHEDKLNLVFHAGGRTLINDPSIYQYKQDEWEPYWRSSRGHSSVMIDGKGQNRRLLPRPEPRPDPDATWITSAGFDYAAGWFKEGYALRLSGLYQGDRREAELASVDQSLQHRRAILFIKGEYAVLSDWIVGSGPHQVEQIFHLAPVVESPSEEGVGPGSYTVERGNVVRTTDAGLTNLAIIPVAGERLGLRVETGQENPVVGWTALYKKCPSPDVTYSLAAPLPLVLTDLLLPLRPGEGRLPVVSPLAVQAGDAATVAAFQAERDGARDWCILAHGGSQAVRCEDVAFEGEALWLRRDPSGRLLRALGANLRALRVGGQTLVDSPELVPAFHWSA